MTWRESLPEEMKSWEEVKNAETAEAFYTQVGNMRSALGQSIRIPSEDASDEVKQAFQTKLTEKVPNLIQMGDEDEVLKRLGRPETADLYESENESLKTQAHAAGLTKKQFAKLAELTAEANTNGRIETETRRTEATTALKAKWGQAYDEKRAAAELIRAQYFPFAPTGEELSTEFIEAMASLGDQMQGESKGLQTEGHPLGALTPAEAKMRIGEIMNNPEHAYWNKRNIAHDAARTKMRELNQAAYN